MIEAMLSADSVTYVGMALVLSAGGITLLGYRARSERMGGRPNPLVVVLIVVAQIMTAGLVYLALASPSARVLPIY